ncbi:MAG: sensor histidine kinase [Salinibacter sp.]
MSNEQINWPTRREWAWIVGFWALFALLSIGQDLLGDPHGEMGWTKALGELAEYGTWALLTPLIFGLADAAPVVESALTSWSNALRDAALHLGALLTVPLLVDVSEELVLSGLAGGWAAPLRSAMNFWFMDELVVYLVVVLAGIARSYYLQKKVRQEEAERLAERTEALETQLTEARLEALRRQLNPHFLFNTLHAVSTLVDRDPTGVRRMIARLSELLRHVLDEETPQEVPLSEEMAFLSDYLEIQSIRFQGGLETSVDVPATVRDARVPNLLLQPVVDNAIRHGASKVRGQGRIQITARREEDMLVITVADNGPARPPEGDEGLGLRNVRTRLRVLYGTNQDLRTEARTENGTRAVIRLPYHTDPSLPLRSDLTHASSQSVPEVV